jgi:hypothetical protein
MNQKTDSSVDGFAEYRRREFLDEDEEEEMPFKSDSKCIVSYVFEKNGLAREKQERLENLAINGYLDTTLLC